MTVRVLWTDEEIAQVKRMYQEEGCSCQEIAMGLRGRSRNAVIGLINRQGFRRPEPAQLTPDEKKEKRRRQRSQQMRRYRERVKNGTVGGPRNKVKPPKRKFVPVLVEKSLGIDLMDLTPTSCRYPVTDASPHKFCGLTATHGSWCEAHFHACTREPVEQNRDAA